MTLRHPILRYVPLLLIGLAWEAASRLGLVSTVVLPPLSKVIEAWSNLALDGDLVSNSLASLYRSGIGLALAIVVGALLGIAMGVWRPANIVLGPLVEALYPIPKSALIPVTALWLGFGDGSKILLIFLGCMLPVTLGAFNGVRGRDMMLVWSARSLGASPLRLLRDVIFPSAVPELLNGIRVALALSFVLLVSSELIASRKGLGFMIGVLGDGGNYDGMFATVLTVAALGFVADRVFIVVSNRLLGWRA